MLDDYGTPERFWAEAINTACHASNRVYIHKLLEKTSYELLVGRKPNISYFRVFGCKCFIYKKKRLGKFESKCDEGFFLGYASNSKAYRVFNKTSRLVEETCDVEFDETNGSQGEGFSCDDIGDEPLREVMKNIALGQVKPKEEDEELPSPSNQVEATCKDDSKVDEDNVNYESSNEEGDASHSPQDIQGGQVVEDQLSFHDTHITNE